MHRRYAGGPSGIGSARHPGEPGTAQPRTSLNALGWSGPYLADGIEQDAWGRAYLINVFYLDARNFVQEPDGTPLGAVFVLSAGPNGELDTPFAIDGVVPGDDDLIRVIAGGSR